MPSVKRQHHPDVWPSGGNPARHSAPSDCRRQVPGGDERPGSHDDGKGCPPQPARHRSAAEMLGIVVVSTGAYHEEGEDAAFEAARKHIPRINHIFMVIVGLLILAQACVLHLFWGQQGDSEQM